MCMRVCVFVCMCVSVCSCAWMCVHACVMCGCVMCECKSKAKSTTSDNQRSDDNCLTLAFCLTIGVQNINTKVG